MNRRAAIVLILMCASVMTVIGQKRPYDTIMKEVNMTFSSLKQNLDSGALPVAAEEAAKLQNLFKETEDFWTPFKTKDAIDFAKGAASGSSAIAAAAREGSAQKAQAAYTAIGKNCKGCHDSHRELMPDKSFRIKP